MDNLLTFLKSQKLLTIACHSPNDIWVANVYYGIDDDCTFYFVSPETTKHSAMILKNKNIAFATARFAGQDHTKRKGVQGQGSCRIVENVQEIGKGIILLNNRFPDLKKTITLEWITNNIWKTKMWIITPSRIKYWDDEIYKDEESKEFNFAVKSA